MDPGLGLENAIVQGLGLENVDAEGRNGVDVGAVPQGVDPHGSEKGKGLHLNEREGSHFRTFRVF